MISKTNKLDIGTIVRKGSIATAIATVMNAGLYLIGTTFTFPADAITPMGVPITIVPVISVSVIAGVTATVGYFVLTVFLAKETANRVMLVLSAIVLIGMFFSPFGIENAPFAQIAILEIMHFVAALPVWRLIRS